MSPPLAFLSPALPCVARRRTPPRCRRAPSMRDRDAGEEDVLLARELRRKVSELYGGAENVAISSTRDGVDFRVIRGPARDEEAQVRSAWITLASIGVVAVLSVAAFGVLMSVGAVHGSGVGEREYEMPAYGRRSYVNPYELLEQEAEEVQQAGGEK